MMRNRLFGKPIIMLLLGLMLMGCMNQGILNTIEVGNSIPLPSSSTVTGSNGVPVFISSTLVNAKYLGGSTHNSVARYMDGQSNVYVPGQSGKRATFYNFGFWEGDDIQLPLVEIDSMWHNNDYMDSIKNASKKWLAEYSLYYLADGTAYSECRYKLRINAPLNLFYYCYSEIVFIGSIDISTLAKAEVTTTTIPNTTTISTTTTTTIQNADTSSIADTSETGRLFFNTDPGEYSSASYAGGTLYHWIWTSVDKRDEIGIVLLSKGYELTYTSPENAAGTGPGWCATRIEMNTVSSPRYYSVEYFDGNGKCWWKNYTLASSSATVGNSSITTQADSSLIIATAIKNGEIVATGSRGDYIVKVQSSDKLLLIAKSTKTAMFLSIGPFQYVTPGYILINVVPLYSQYRVLDPDVAVYNGQMYAVEVQFR